MEDRKEAPPPTEIDDSRGEWLLDQPQMLSQDAAVSGRRQRFKITWHRTRPDLGVCIQPLRGRHGELRIGIDVRV